MEAQTSMKNRNRILSMLVLALLVVSEPGLAQRRGGGGARGGGMRGGGGGMRGGGMRSTARPSVSSRGGGFGGGFGGGSRPNIGSGSRPSVGTPAVNRGNVGSNVNRGDIGRTAGNRTLSASDINGIRGGNTINNRPVVGNDIDINGGYGGGYYGGYGGCCYHPVAAGVGLVAGAAITAAAIGSTVYSLPSDCVVTSVNGVTYQQCGSTWYQPQFEGENTTYVVVNPPQ